jgi:hypothetical protein
MAEEPIIDPIPAPTPANPNMVAYVNLLAEKCVVFRRIFDEAGGLAKEYVALDYRNKLAQTDLTGNMAGLTPEHIAKVVEFVGTIDKLVDTQGQSATGLTFRQAVFGMSRASR